MKVVHVITELNVGGAEYDLYKLIAHGDRSTFDYVVISLQDKGAFGDKIEALGVPVYTLDLNPARPNPLALLKLIRILRRERPDVLHTWLYHADFLGTLAAYFVPKTRLFWSIVAVSGASFSGNLRLIYKACAKLSSRADVIVANTKNGYHAHVADGYKDGTWPIIYNGFDTDTFKPDPTARQKIRAELDIPEDAFVIGKVGRLVVQKNYPGFIRAAVKLLRSHPNVHFVGVGKDVSLDTLGEEIPADLRGNFHLLGLRKDTAAIYNALDIFTITSDFEGLPNVIGEAMSTRLPCVVTDTGDIAHLVADTGIIVPVRDIDALAAAWEKLITLPADERIQLGHVARKRILEHFSLDLFVQNYQQLYMKNCQLR